MSPEQVEGRPVDARSDIFSFGAVLYEMVTGQRAFRGESRSPRWLPLWRRTTTVSEISSGTPPEVERLIARCLRKDVNRRSQRWRCEAGAGGMRDESESGKLARPAAAGDAGARRGSGRWWRWHAC